MKKVVIGQPRKQRPDTRKVLELNVETPHALEDINVNNKGQKIATDFSQLSDLSTYKMIKIDIDSILKQKSKSAIIKKLESILADLPRLCKDYDEIGLGTYTRQIKRSVIPSMQELYSDMIGNKIKPREFLIRIENIQDVINELDPAVTQKKLIRDDAFKPMKDMFSDIKNVRVTLNNKTPAFVTKAPVSLFLKRKLSDLCHAMLEKHFGAKFVPYTGALLLTDVKFLIINKNKFDTSDMQSVVSSVISALFRGQNVVPVHHISKDASTFYAVMIISHNHLRVISELVESYASMEIHITSGE